MVMVKKLKTQAGRCLLALTAAAVLLSCSLFCWTPAIAQQEEQNQDSGSCIDAELETVKTSDLEETIQSIGSIEAFQKVSVHPETDGKIVSLHFKEGAKVKDGELLFTLDDAKIRAELKARNAALEEAEANLENAGLVYERRQRLYEQNVGTEEARDEARTRYQALKAQVKRLTAEIESINETLEDTRIRAPFDGIAGGHLVDVGQVVNTNSALTSVVQVDRLEIAFTVPERYAGRIRTGQEIRVTAPGYPDKDLSGAVYFVDPQIEPVTRSLKIKARMNNPENLLRPGGFVSVELIVGIHENTPVISEEALIPTRNGYMVFVIEDSRANGREVEIGIRKPGIVEITKGLKRGETIVKAGHISLHEGAKVCTD